MRTVQNLCSFLIRLFMQAGVDKSNPLTTFYNMPGVGQHMTTLSKTINKL